MPLDEIVIYWVLLLVLLRVILILIDMAIQQCCVQ